jgi:hypothetical protein
MPLSNDNQLPPHGPEEVDASHGYERSDVRVTGIVVFLAALGIFVAVTGVLCYGIGKVINSAMNKEDGPTNHWVDAKAADVRQLGNLPNNPDLQNKVAELTQKIPTPRLQEDDGNQDIANLHAREDILLDYYTRIEGKPDKVRIPIEHAMELIAQRGLPVVPQNQQQAKLMTGESKPEVSVPLTSGFARTGYEQDQQRGEGGAAERPAVKGVSVEKGGNK